jgi:hypothetical protein
VYFIYGAEYVNVESGALKGTRRRSGRNPGGSTVSAKTNTKNCIVRIVSRTDLQLLRLIRCRSTVVLVLFSSRVCENEGSVGAEGVFCVF